jgi:type I restriction enzyme, R subunit
MSAELLYESPFVDIDPRGPNGLFTDAQVKGIVKVLEQVRLTALAQ